MVQKMKKNRSHGIDRYEKKVIKDNIHWNCNKMDSFDKTFNFVISAREPGKSTVLNTKLFKKLKHNHARCLIIRRRPVDITEGYINSIATTINKFLPPHQRITFYFNKGDMKAGQVDIYLDPAHTELFGRVQALNIPSERAKSNFIKNVAIILYDEFIPNDTKAYLPKEVQNFYDVYSTYYREFKGHLKCYFSGNPYTIFNPFFSKMNICISDIKPGAFLVGEDYVLDFPVITPELRAYILNKNPLYKFDDEYTNYALNGIAINDAKYNIVPKKPNPYYKLKHVFRIGGTYLYVWRQASNISGSTGYCDKFWIETSKKLTKTNKKIYAVDFDNLIQNTQLVTKDVKVIMQQLKWSVAHRNIGFQNVDAAVLVENLYTVI